MMSMPESTYVQFFVFPLRSLPQICANASTEVNFLRWLCVPAFLPEVALRIPFRVSSTLSRSGEHLICRCHR